MPDFGIQLWIPVAIALVAPLFTYLAMRRKSSGTVGTSEADVLWRESGEIRKSLQDRVSLLETRLDELSTKLNTLFEEAVRLRAERDFLERENTTLKSLIEKGVGK